MNVIAFAASNNAQSINKLLASYTANLMDGARVEVLDINDFEMPIFSTEREEALGQPEQAQRFYRKIGDYVHTRHLNADINFKPKNGNSLLPYLALTRRFRDYWEKTKRDQKMCTRPYRLHDNYCCFRVRCPS
jgi:hypothetical protein